MSHTLFDELAEVIARPKFASLFQHTTRTHQQNLCQLHVLTEMVTIPSLSHPACRDPDDDAVLACALTAQTDWIVSSNDDLLPLNEFQRMPIITAAGAMERVTAQKNNSAQQILFLADKDDTIKTVTSIPKATKAT